MGKNLKKKLVKQLARYIELQEEQNTIMRQVWQTFFEKQIEPLTARLLDNADLKHLLKIGDTKFFRVKKLFKTYRMDGKDYYLSDEILESLRKHENTEDDP